VGDAETILGIGHDEDGHPGNALSWSRRNTKDLILGQPLETLQLCCDPV
jgi:hypothetical protein